MMADMCQPAYAVAADWRERQQGPEWADQANPSGAACATPSAHRIRGVAVDADLIALALASLAAIVTMIVLIIASLRNPPRD